MPASIPSARGAQSGPGRRSARREARAGVPESSTNRRLRQAIVDLVLAGDIPAGKRIDQRVLAKKLRTTTAPLREALSALESEGLLVREQGVGVFCRIYTVLEIEEMVDIRGVLEALAARRATAYVSDEEIQELRDLASILGAPIPRDGEADFVRTHVKFHKRIVEISRSPRLALLLEHHHLIDGLLANLAPSLWASEPHDHQGIVDALATRNPTVAEQAMRAHIAPTFVKRFAELRKRFGDGPIMTFPLYGASRAAPARGVPSNGSAPDRAGGRPNLRSDRNSAPGEEIT